MVIFLDIETQNIVREDREVSGLRVSVAGIRHNDVVEFFSETELSQLFSRLDLADVIVGHNLLGFDYKVLQKYARFDIVNKYKQKTFDIFFLLLRKTDRRISLNDLAQRNLASAKLGLGIDAPKLFQEGRISELQLYLAQDLLLLEQLYNHIRAHGTLRYGHISYKEPIEREVKISIDER